MKVNTFVHVSGLQVSVQAISSSEQRSPFWIPVGITVNSEACCLQGPLLSTLIKFTAPRGHEGSARTAVCQHFTRPLCFMSWDLASWEVRGLPQGKGDEMISEVLIVPLHSKDPVQPPDNVFRLPCFWLLFYSQDYQPETELLIFARRDDVGLDFPLGSNRKWRLPCVVWLPALTRRRVTALSSPLSDSFVLAPLPVPPGCRWGAAWREGNLRHIVIYISETTDQRINLYWLSFIETTDLCYCRSQQRAGKRV